MDLLLRAPGTEGRPLVLMCEGTDTAPGRWGLPGIDPGCDTLAQVAHRGVAQAGGDPIRLRVRTENEHTVTADLGDPFPPSPSPTGEVLRWVPESEVAALDLEPGFAARWPALRAPETGLLVDGANVVGSRPDGWWRDRAGAATRLLAAVAAAAPGVFPAPDGTSRWVNHPVVVLEGLARTAPGIQGIEVVRAAGSGDDAIIDVTRRGGRWLVVTADRELRTRLPSQARPVGPAALWAWLDPPASR